VDENEHGEFFSGFTLFGKKEIEALARIFRGGVGEVQFWFHGGRDGRALSVEEGMREQKKRGEEKAEHGKRACMCA
jgi:hypothetical protein